MEKTYVEMLLPGSFFPESETRDVESRDPLAVAATAPANCFAFTFYDREEEEKGGEMLTGHRKNRSGRFYIGGMVVPVDDLLASIPDLPTDIMRMAENAKINGWKRLIKCRTGNWQPFEDRDTLLPEVTA